MRRDKLRAIEVDGAIAKYEEAADPTNHRVFHKVALAQNMGGMLL